MSFKRVLYVTGIVCAVLLVAVFSVTPGFAAALPDEPEPLEDDINSFCENLDDIDVQHPMGARLAEAFEVEYDDIMGWFCEDEMGFGQIMLALTTAQVYDGEAVAADFLARRAAGEGWGQIWQEEGLIGRGRPKGDGENDDVEPPEDAGPAGPSENRGRPEGTGRPENPGRSNGVGPGDNRGLHLGHFKDKDE